MNAPDPEDPRVTPDWLALREPVDAAARSVELVDLLRPRLPAGAVRIHDLGAGTGSMLRWLAPRLAGAQHWVLHERDTRLHAATVTDGLRSLDGAAVTAETRDGDLTRLAAADLPDASLITASALLDMFTADELGRVVDTVVAVGVPALLTLSVVGEVTMEPTDPLDAEVARAFNAHQCRTVDGRTLLGPRAAALCAEALRGRGFAVSSRPSVWRMGAGEAQLTQAWLDGWLSAAFAHDPDLGRRAEDYAATRRREASSGALAVRVHHLDLLALPG